MKKRILFCGEASWLATGYATYNREILSGLHKTGKYVIAEMGSYGSEKSKEASELPWKFYGILPVNKQEDELYRKNPKNQFGGYKYDAILADFQPDIVFDPRDPWMFDHVISSRFRDNYISWLMPTVDSAPQKKEWVDGLFKKSDIITTYSRFGKRELESWGVNVMGVTSPGLDTNIFKPLDKAKLRSDWGFKKGLKIIGTVMRNQKRKLFPELFEGYAKLRREHGHIREVQKSVLLCHTSWPDVGWDIPELLNRSGIQRHVIFTYICDSCNKTFFSWFIPTTGDKGLGKCIFCGKLTAHMPSTHKGVSTSELVEIFNLMDIYVQPAICEGWGLPIVESKACGIPGLYSNYSAMEDHVQNGGGLSIDIDRLYTEAETMAKRSLPNLDSMVAGMKKLLINHKLRHKLAEEARECAIKMHNWDLAVEKFQTILDAIEIKDRNQTWDRRKFIKVIPRYKPQNVPPEVFIRWCYNTYLDREPEEKGFNDWMKDIANGRSAEDVENFFKNELISHNRFEEIRWKKSLEIRGLDDGTITLISDRLPGIVL